jgi:hypothetical protein
MFLLPITDWDNAYANAPNIPNGDQWPARWAAMAQAFRERMVSQGRAQLDQVYGAGSRQRFDLFWPACEAKGLVVVVHGGFWMRFDKSMWSHLAAGCVEMGFAVAVPSYTLCPEVRIRDISREIAQAIVQTAARVAGPIHLVGHSAGGHLVTRMVTTTTPLPEEVGARIGETLSISGLHDLRPLMRTALNTTLKIDETEALEESPALLQPRTGVRLTCWVGASERAEFIRQNALLGNVWTGLGAGTRVVEEPDRHHFDVVEGLLAPSSPLLTCLLQDDGSAGLKNTRSPLAFYPANG